jgi:hypothetical protein
MLRDAELSSQECLRCGGPETNDDLGLQGGNFGIEPWPTSSDPQGAVKHLAEAAKTSRTTREEIKSRLRVRGKQTELSHARLICLRSDEPLAVDEIARRILANGYSSRSKTFTDYVRRLLRQDDRFVANAGGLWMLHAAA